MENNDLNGDLVSFQEVFDGDLFLNDSWRLMYATDASAYREIPSGVARPRNAAALKHLVRFANEHHIPLIPRAAGTSLAGQVVGNGLVVDISKYMTCILEVNKEEHWVRVEPGVILDELNKYVEPAGLFFGPETSTSSRCTIGGMVGNNSCGAHSIIYGSTRDHVVSMKVILSNGSEAEFRELSTPEFREKLNGDDLENKIYRQISDILSDPDNQAEIRKEFPDPVLHRRNTGYAIDLLLETEPFINYELRITNYGLRITDYKIQHPESSIQHPAPGLQAQAFNFCKLLAGSEGTLAFTTEIKLNLVPLPPKHKALICVHCHSVSEALKANLIALKYSPGSVELMDKPIMDCTKDNIMQRKNRFFIEGDPEAILIIEFARESREEILEIASRLENEMRYAGYGYHFPVIFPPDLKKVWDLRKAGLGVLSNYPGDRKPVPVTEDTAVRPEDLPDYIDEFARMLARHERECVYYAHVGSGELHLRPVLNLKVREDVELFHTIALETAKLVKKYRGSLSGEHGDGRLRGEFIPMMIGEKNYGHLKEIKELWDPNHIFNPGKITDTPAMNSSLRYIPGKKIKDIPTYFDFSSSHGVHRAAEQCNGSGDCRNTALTGKWMCPSYMAVGDESTTTRARANLLREFLTNSPKRNPFDHFEIYEVMDLCLSCKACKSECPSNVDIAKLKAEFLQHYYDANGIPFRSWVIANITHINRIGTIAPALFNFFLGSRKFSGLMKDFLGFAPDRNIPHLCRTTLRAWAAGQVTDVSLTRTVYLFADEFSNFNDVEIGIKAIRLLNALGYKVIIPDHKESGRTYLSKGMIRKAKKLAIKNVGKLKDLVTENTPLIGIEPSAILTFRDEYPELVTPKLKEAAKNLAKNCLLFEEFLTRDSVLGARYLVSGTRSSGLESQQLAVGSQQSVVMNELQTESKEPSTQNRVSRTEYREPSTEYREPRTENREPRTALSDLFTKEPKLVRLHGHCHQKALASTEPLIRMLSIPENYKVEEIKSGCCGMAGSFGYEKEHYDVSMKIGELVLFPEVRKSGSEVIIAAPGTSCRQQIMDGTGRKAVHPVEVLYDALVQTLNIEPSSAR
jgi:FAD/FMN-containing dehydrogenase/Fe-S oxidoreductase